MLLLLSFFSYIVCVNFISQHKHLNQTVQIHMWSNESKNRIKTNAQYKHPRDFLTHRRKTSDVFPVYCIQLSNAADDNSCKSRICIIDSQIDFLSLWINKRTGDISRHGNICFWRIFIMCIVRCVASCFLGSLRCIPLRREKNSVAGILSPD